MIRPLYLRLVALYALLSALALGLALGAGGVLEARSIRQQEDDSLIQATAALARQISGNRVVTDGWLSQQETLYSCLFYLEDGGLPLAHTQKTGASDRVTPQLLAQCSTLEPGQSGLFTFEPDQGGRWQCAALAVPPTNLRHEGRLVLALRDTSGRQARMAQVAAKYLGLWAVGVLLLTGAGALLAKFALRPTKEALQQQNEFVAAASHELRTPLTVIRSSLQAMEVQPQRREKLTSIALGEVERLQRLTEELLFLAGQDAHILRLHPQAVEPDTFLLEVWEAWQAPVREQGRKLTLSLPQTSPASITADRQRLEQLFSILLHNALEYAPENSSIQLSLEDSTQWVIFRVSDHGPGVSDQDRQRIFQRFVRGEASRTGKEHFGLGLSIAAQIAQLHKGRLWVEDTPGGGATFCLQLPL